MTEAHIIVGAHQDFETYLEKNLGGGPAGEWPVKKSALASLREYSHTLELGLRILLQQPEYADRTAKLATDPYQRNQLGIILFGPD